MIYGLLFARTAIPWSLRHATVWICRATRSFIIDIDLWGDVFFFRVFSRNEILHPTAVVLQDFLATERGMKAMETGWALIGHGGLAFGPTCSFTVHQTGRKCRWNMGNLSTEGKGMTMNDMKIRGEAVDGMLLRWHSHGYECCWLWWWCGFVVSFNALSTWARRNSLK